MILVNRNEKILFWQDLLDGVVASEVIHHVALGPEALSTILRAVIRPVIVMNTHVDKQIVPIVERLEAVGHSAYKF